MINTDWKRRSSVQPRRWRLDQPSPHNSEPLIDFSKPELWNERTQQIVDEFRVKLENFRLHICPTCSRFQSFNRHTTSEECGHCASQRRKGKISRFGAANDMDPGKVCYPSSATALILEKVPNQLKGLTQLEQMLIARVNPVMTVYTIKGGQRKGSKHVINFPQNVSRLASVLPQLPDDVPLIVRRSNIGETRHYDFLVRQRKIISALEWLKENNKWYRDISISEERMSQLPINENLEDRFSQQVMDNHAGSLVPSTNGGVQATETEETDVNRLMGMATLLNFGFDL